MSLPIDSFVVQTKFLALVTFSQLSYSCNNCEIQLKLQNFPWCKMSHCDHASTISWHNFFFNKSVLAVIF